MLLALKLLSHKPFLWKERNFWYLNIAIVHFTRRTVLMPLPLNFATSRMEYPLRKQTY